MSQIFGHFVTHELSHTRTLGSSGGGGGGGEGGGTRGVPASSRPVIANYCSQACGFGFRDSKLRVTQARPWGRGFSVTPLH